MRYGVGTPGRRMMVFLILHELRLCYRCGCATHYSDVCNKHPVRTLAAGLAWGEDFIKDLRTRWALEVALLEERRKQEQQDVHASVADPDPARFLCGVCPVRPSNLEAAKRLYDGIHDVDPGDGVDDHYQPVDLMEDMQDHMDAYDSANPDVDVDVAGGDVDVDVLPAGYVGIDHSPRNLDGPLYDASPFRPPPVDTTIRGEARDPGSQQQLPMTQDDRVGECDAPAVDSLGAAVGGHVGAVPHRDKYLPPIPKYAPYADLRRRGVVAPEKVRPDWQHPLPGAPMHGRTHECSTFVISICVVIHLYYAVGVSPLLFGIVICVDQLRTHY